MRKTTLALTVVAISGCTPTETALFISAMSLIDELDAWPATSQPSVISPYQPTYQPTYSTTSWEREMQAQQLYEREQRLHELEYRLEVLEAENLARASCWPAPC